MLTLLFVDDDAREVAILSQVLTEYHVVGASCAAEGLEKIASGRVDILLLDLNLPDMNGFSVLEHMHNMEDPPPVIILSVFGSPENVVRAIQLGAADFMQKPFTLLKLKQSIERALRRENEPRRGAEPEKFVENFVEKNEVGAAESQWTYEPASSPAAGALDPPSREEQPSTARDMPPLAEKEQEEREKGTNRDPLARFAGTSKAVSLLKSYIRLYAAQREPVLLVGESGTGKEVLSRAVHRLSDRREGPFIPLNAAAIPESIIESELFGTVTGAFTGAVSRPGYFEQAAGGTLFLDEIGEMPLSAQVKLLRILEDGSVLRVGARRKKRIDVRLICATNRPIERMVREGSFRQDLYHRINTLSLPIPPLRSRIEDIPELALLFFREEGVAQHRIETQTLRRLMDYDWPGNTRELKNTIKRAVVLSDGGQIEPRHIFFSLDLQAYAES